MKKFNGGFFIIYYFWLLLFMILTVQGAYPLSFRLYDAGARAQGQAGAYTASPSDASAVYYNPASLPSLQGNQVLSGTEVLLLDTDYTSPSGVKESSDNGWGMVPHTYAAIHLSDRWSLGLGAYSVFGLLSNYSDRGVLRYVATNSELRTVTLSPVLAYQMTPELAIGTGMNILVGELGLRSKIDFGALAGAPGAADGDLDINEDGTALGFNVGIAYQPHPRHHLGIVFHSAMDVDLDGTASIGSIPSALGLGSRVDGHVSSTVDLPSILRFGYAYYPTERWKLETDVEWTNFSTFRHLDFKSANPLFPSTSVAENHDDAYVFSLGTEYCLNDQWSVRGGYGHVLDAVPASTFSPVIPGADRNFFTLGLSFKWRAWTLDAAYQFILFDDRRINNDVGSDIGTTVDGFYESTVHAVALDVRVAY